MAKSRFAFSARMLARAIFVAVSLAALALALAPHPPRVLGWDKAEHFVGGAVIALLALPAMPGLALGWLIGGLAAAAALVEVLQATPQIGRAGDPVDWFAGVLGALLTIILCRLAMRLRKRATPPIRPWRAPALSPTLTAGDAPLIRLTVNGHAPSRKAAD